MKLLICFVVVLFIASQADAQILADKDTSDRMPAVHIGVGVFLGSHLFIPNNESKSQNLGGYNQGGFIKAIFEFSYSFNTSFDLRYFRNSVVVNYYDNKYPDVFLIKRDGLQIPIFLTHKIHNAKRKEILNYSLGLAYTSGYYTVFYEELVDPIFQSSVPARHKSDVTLISDLSGIISINKEFLIGKRSKLSFFSEYEMRLNKLNIEDITNAYIARGDLKYFSPLSFRLGCQYIY